MRKIFVLQDKDTQSDSISTWARELATAFKHETDSISADKNTSADDFAKHLEDEDASLLIIELNDKKHIQQYLNLCRGLRVPYLFIRPQQAFRIDKISLPITFLVEDKEKILNPAVVKVIPVPLSYKIKDKDGNFKLVRYYVKWIEPDASYWLVVKISWCRGKTTLWAKINWSVKDEWKWSKLWLVKNYTDLSSDLVRKNIHKNALDLTRNREDSKWKKLNKVYYNDKTTKYSDIRNQLEKWDTVIIKNANFIINDDIRKKIGIIVLKDNYKIEPQTLDWWNIFIGKYTEKINAYIYADWAIMSKNEKWEEYEDYDLATPLEINWSVFSRNTIGWAVAWISEGNFYILPGGEKTKDFKLAEQYDLNYIRKAPLCKEEDFSLKINYDPEIQINPPKWFSETK